MIFSQKSPNVIVKSFININDGIPYGDFMEFPAISLNVIKFTTKGTYPQFLSMPKRNIASPLIFFNAFYGNYYSYLIRHKPIGYLLTHDIEFLAFIFFLISFHSSLRLVLPLLTFFKDSTTVYWNVFCVGLLLIGKLICKNI